MLGREYEGINRITYLLDENGVVKHVWPTVKPKDHADEILAGLKS